MKVRIEAQRPFQPGHRNGHRGDVEPFHDENARKQRERSDPTAGHVLFSPPACGRPGEGLSASKLPLMPTLDPARKREGGGGAVPAPPAAVAEGVA